MDLPTIAIIASLASPLLTAAVAWGAYGARIKAVEGEVVRLDRENVRAHTRIDSLRDAPA